MGEPGFWDDQGKAAKISSEHARVGRRLERYERLASEESDLTEFLPLASDDGELQAVEQGVQALTRALERLQEDAMFNGEYDAGAAVV